MSELINIHLRLTEEQADNLIKACKKGDKHHQFEGYSQSPVRKVVEAKVICAVETAREENNLK